MLLKNTDKIYLVKHFRRDNNKHANKNRNIRLFLKSSFKNKMSWLKNMPCILVLHYYDVRVFREASLSNNFHTLD